MIQPIGSLAMMMCTDSTREHLISMQAILQIPGPVVTPRAINHNNKLRRLKVTADHFLTAAKELEKLNIGTLHTQQISGPTSHAFVKNPPDQVEKILLLYPELCDIHDYRMRYNLPIPKSVLPSQVKKLVEMGFVSMDRLCL